MLIGRNESMVSMLAEYHTIIVPRLTKRCQSDNLINNWSPTHPNTQASLAITALGSVAPSGGAKRVPRFCYHEAGQRPEQEENIS